MMNRYHGIVVAGLILGCAMAWGQPAYAGAERRCQMCHDFTTGKNGIGPSLKGILGRKAGTYPGYKYTFTKYIKGEPWVWTEERLREWDNNSEKAIKKFTGNPDARTLMPPQHRMGADEDEIISFIKVTSEIPNKNKENK
jgi:cytochrome c2